MSRLKQTLILALTLILLPLAAFSDDSANINIKISGTMPDNRYFLCMPNVGCLSILAGDRGKVYTMFESVDMHHVIYLNDLNSAQTYAQVLPPSCRVTVDTGHTITISGHITKASNDMTYISGLSCSVSKS